MPTDNPAQSYTYLVDPAPGTGQFTVRVREFPAVSITANHSHSALRHAIAAVAKLLQACENPPAPAGARPADPLLQDYLKPASERPLPVPVLLAAAGSASKPFPADRPEGQQVITGSKANLLYTPLPADYARTDALEPKGGDTPTAFWHRTDLLDVRSRANPLDDLTDPLLVYHAAYPGDAVPFAKRKFPAVHVYLAAGGYSFSRHPHANRRHLKQTLGTIADITHVARGCGWGHGRILHVSPKPGHGAAEFWDRLRAELAA